MFLYEHNVLAIIRVNSVKGGARIEKYGKSKIYLIEPKYKTIYSIYNA
jgi:hypothetical protein